MCCGGGGVLWKMSKCVIILQNIIMLFISMPAAKTKKLRDAILLAMH